MNAKMNFMIAKTRAITMLSLLAQIAGHDFQSLMPCLMIDQIQAWPALSFVRIVKKNILTH